jgi:hypothetical protein
VPRACKNWLDTFVDLHKETSPAPTSFLEWSGLFCISSVVKRKVEFSREHLKTFRVYPNIYAIFVAPPGVAHKSTTAGLGMEVISEMLNGMPITDPSYVNIGQSSGSHIGIVESLKDSLDGSVSIVAGEFGTLASYTPVETYDFLSHMFDSDKIAERFVHKTRRKGAETIVKPSVNILGCTTPAWLTENAGYVMGGGFAARVVFVFESKSRYRRLFSKGIGPSVKEQNEIRKNLAEDLKKIGKLKGEVKPETDELSKEIDEWYSVYENFRGEKGTETFQARKHVHVLRNAMLLSLCERDDLIITKDHYLKARQQIESVEGKLGRGLAVLGKNPLASLYYSVLDFITDNGPVERGKIMARFWQDLQGGGQALGEILEILKVSGEIEMVKGVLGKDDQWRIKKKK